MASLDAIRPPTPASGAVRHTKPGNARRRSCSGVVFIVYMLEKTPSIEFWPTCSGANLTSPRGGRQGGRDVRTVSSRRTCPIAAAGGGQRRAAGETPGRGRGGPRGRPTRSHGRAAGDVRGRGRRSTAEPRGGRGGAVRAGERRRR